MENLIVPKNPRSTHHRPALSIVGDDALPDVRVVEIGTVPMTEEQHTAAVHALAALIGNWRDTRTGEDDADRRAA